MKAERTRSLQPRDSPIAIRPKASSSVILSRSNCPPIFESHVQGSRRLSTESLATQELNPRPRQDAGGHASYSGDLIMNSPPRGLVQQDAPPRIMPLPDSMSQSTSTHEPTSRRLPAMPNLSSTLSDDAPKGGSGTTTTHTAQISDPKMVFRFEWQTRRSEMQIAGGNILVPSALSLSQYCLASSAATSTPINFLRNTYLARLASGAYLLAETRFTSIIAPILDGLDDNSLLVINDPMRLHSKLSNSCFQEAYILSLRETLHSAIHPLRVWWTALFLLVMSLELGMFSTAVIHLSEALACAVQPDVLHLMKTISQEAYAHLLFFLSESTYRYASMIALVKGSKPYFIAKDDLITVKHPLDIVLRDSTVLRVKVIDILYMILHPADGSSDRDRAKVGLDAATWEICELEKLQQKHVGGQTQDLSADGPFGYKTFAYPEWAHASLAILFNKLLLSNVVSTLQRRALLQEYFAILAHLALVSQQKCTLDLLATAVAVVMLEDPHERRWAIEVLRTGIERGCSLLIPLEVFEKCVFYTWQAVDSKPLYGVEQDWELISTLQHAFRSVI